MKLSIRTDSGFDWRNSLALLSGIFGICIGAAVMIGWHLQTPELVQLRPHWVPMQYNTALCFFLASCALVAAALGQTRVPLVVGVFVAGVGLLSGAQYALAANLGIDELLFSHDIVIKTSSPGRMAPNTAMCFMLLGWAMFLIGYRLRRGQPSSAAIMLASLCVGLALVALAGYVTGFEPAYGWAQFTQMAVHTAVAFGVLGVGVTAFHWPRSARGSIDISRLTAALMSVTTLGVLLIVLVAAAIGLIPLYDQVRQSLDSELSRQLQQEVAEIQQQFSRTAGFAGSFSGVGLDSDLISRLELPAEERSRLLAAYKKVQAWPGPGRAYLGMLKSNGAGVLDTEADGRLRLSIARPLIAQAITRGIRGERGVVASERPDSGEQSGPVSLAFFAPVAGTSWVAVSEVLAQELYQPADQRLVLIVMIVMLVALCGAFGMARLMQPLTSGILVHSADLERRVEQATDELQKNLVKLEEKNRELEQFSYVVSHDLQAPLRGIEGFASLLQRKHAASLDKEGLEFLGFIREGTTQMRDFIQGFLELSRLGSRSQPMAAVDLKALLEELRGQLSFSLADEQATLVAEDLPQVHGDASQLRQLFQNLIENAIKFRSPGKPPVITIDASKQEQRWRIRVADNGIGIKPAERENVFRMFGRAAATESVAGTGIGLALCKKIVERHGGEIAIQDSVQGGAMFVFTLPGLDSEQTDLS